MGSSNRKRVGNSWVFHGSEGSKDSRVSFSLTLLSLSFHSRLFSSSSRGGNMAVGISVESMVVGISESWCLDFNGLNLSSLDNWGLVDNGVVKSISKIVGVSLGISLSLGLTLLPCFSLNSWGFSFSGSSGSSYDWESMSPKTISKTMSIDTGIRISSIRISSSVCNNWSGDSSLNFCGLYFNRLDDRGVDDSMVCSKSIKQRRPSYQKLGISLGFSLSANTGNEGDHQQKLHVVIAL